MEKYNFMQQDAVPSWSQPWGGHQPPVIGFNNPKPGTAEPLKPSREEEPDKEEEKEPAKKKRKKNIYEITC